MSISNQAMSVSHTIGEPIVNEHTVTVPAIGHYIGKREAEAEPEADADADADGYNGLSGLGYSGLGYGYARTYAAAPVAKTYAAAPLVRSYAAAPIARSYGYGLTGSYGYGLSGLRAW
jgi:hypothetical protein